MNEITLEERLIALIKDMSEDQQIQLLINIEKQQGFSRKFPRKEVSIPSAYVIKDHIYTDVIKDISAGGVYITTKKSHSVDDEISLNFILSGHKRTIRIFGKIVRSTPNGFAIKFNEIVEELLNTE